MFAWVETVLESWIPSFLVLLDGSGILARSLLLSSRPIAGKSEFLFPRLLLNRISPAVTALASDTTLAMQSVSEITSEVSAIKFDSPSAHPLRFNSKNLAQVTDVVHVLRETLGGMWFVSLLDHTLQLKPARTSFDIRG